MKDPMWSLQSIIKAHAQCNKALTYITRQQVKAKWKVAQEHCGRQIHDTGQGLYITSEWRTNGYHEIKGNYIYIKLYNKSIQQLNQIAFNKKNYKRGNIRCQQLHKWVCIAICIAIVECHGDIALWKCSLRLLSALKARSACAVRRVNHVRPLHRCDALLSASAWACPDTPPHSRWGGSSG